MKSSTKSRSKKLILIESLLIFIIGFALIIIAGFKIFGEDPDFLAYANLINTLNRDRIYEPTFNLITLINFTIDNNNYYITFLIYALISVPLKLYIIKKYSVSPLFSIFIYISMFFFLHEYTQIRASAAIGFYLLAVLFLSTKNYRKFILFILIATSFHYSAAILIAGLALKYISAFTEKIIKYSIISLILVNFSIDSHSFLESTSFFLSDKDISNFGHAQEWNVFNPLAIIFTLFYVFFISKNKKTIKSQRDFQQLALNFYSLGILFYYFFSILSLPVLAYRLLEFFSTILILLIPIFVNSYKQKKIMMIVFSIPTLMIGYHMIFNVVLVSLS